MNHEIQQKVRQTIGTISIVVFAFWSYSVTQYLRTDAPELNPVSYDRFDVVVLGDSITEGLGVEVEENYVQLLRDEFGWAKIRNAGVRGDETADALARLDTDVLAYDPDIVVVFLGGNDYIHRIDPEITFTNLRAIIQRLQEEDIDVLLLGVQGGVWTDLYAPYFQGLAEETEVEFVPNVLDEVMGHFRHMKDPLHPNALGHKMMFERIAPVLGDMLKLYY